MTIVESPLEIRERGGRDEPTVRVSHSGPHVRDTDATRWAAGYVRRALLVDALVGLLAVAAATVTRFGRPPDVGYVLALPLLPLVWCAALAGHGLYDRKYLGAGSEEWRRLLACGVQLGVGLALASFVAHLDVSRVWALVLVSTLTGAGAVGRHVLRRTLHRARRAGRAMNRVVAVGHGQEVAQLLDDLAPDPTHGLAVVGACIVPGADVPALLDRGVDRISGVDGLPEMVASLAADTVVVVGSGGFTPEGLRRLAWQLESSGTDLIVSPGLTEVGSPRLTIRPAANLSLLHVQHAVPDAPHRCAKAFLDRALALSALVVLSPFLLAIAAAVRLTSRGPALYTQRRVGLRGEEFTIFKFRSMVADADARRAALLDLSDGNGVLFKMRDDPRVTRVGAILRRWSLDELPQLLNVVLGQMSLVGPRPPLPEEVATYDDDARRRLRVKPGITGLWQVSGRSDLSWEESLRLDLRYVDNWSLALDLTVLWKTGRALLRGAGAY